MAIRAQRNGAQRCLHGWKCQNHHNPSELKPLLVSVREARRLLGGCGNHRFWALVKTSQIELVGSSRKRGVPTASLEALIERTREEAREVREAKSRSATHEPMPLRPCRKTCGAWSGGMCSGCGLKPGYPKPHSPSAWESTGHTLAGWNWVSEIQQFLPCGTLRRLSG
jgi:hypothetical protein